MLVPTTTTTTTARGSFRVGREQAAADYRAAEEVVREQMAVIKKQIQTQPAFKRSNSEADLNARECEPPKKMAPPKQMSIDKNLGRNYIYHIILSL